MLAYSQIIPAELTFYSHLISAQNTLVIKHGCSCYQALTTSLASEIFNLIVLSSFELFIFLRVRNHFLTIGAKLNAEKQLI